MVEQPRQITEVGVVTSAKMQKTIKVVVERRRQHPFYRKYVTKRTSYFAHDEGQVAKEGDVVEIAQSRPLSKKKRWRLVRVVEKPVPPQVDEVVAGVVTEPGDVDASTGETEAVSESE